MKHTSTTHIKKTVLHPVSIVVAVVIFLGAFVWWLYGGALTPARLTILHMFNAPVGVIGKVSACMRNVEGFGPIAFSSDAITTLKLEAVGRTRGISVEPAELTELAEQLQKSDPQFANAVTEHGIAKAKQLLALPYALKNALRITYMQSGFEPGLVQEIQSVTSQLQQGADWKIVANAHSTDLATNWSGGNTGFVDLRGAIPEYKQAVEGLPLNTISVVYTRYGAHIVEVLHRVPQDSVQMTELREVVLEPKGFDAWLTQELSNVPVKWYVMFPPSIESKN